MHTTTNQIRAVATEGGFDRTCGCRGTLGNGESIVLGAGSSWEGGEKYNKIDGLIKLIIFLAFKYLNNILHVPRQTTHRDALSGGGQLFITIAMPDPAFGFAMVVFFFEDLTPHDYYSYAENLREVLVSGELRFFLLGILIHTLSFDFIPT